MDTWLKGFEELDWKSVLDDLSDGVYMVDEDRRIVYWNHAAEKITGFRAEEILGHRCSENILNHVDERGCELCKAECPLHQTLRDGETRRELVFLRHKDGYRVPVSVAIRPCRDRNGEVRCAVETFRDASEHAHLKERVGELQQTVMQDEVTGLPNRRFGERNILERVEQLRRYECPFGVIFVDLDAFKAINDRWGHYMGDRVLHMAARVLDLNSRGPDHACRWGGDEFVLICPHLDSEGLLEVAERLRVMLESSRVVVETTELTVHASFGATLARPDDGPASIVERADGAMYASKSNGGNRVTLV